MTVTYRNLLKLSQLPEMNIPKVNERDTNTCVVVVGYISPK